MNKWLALFVLLASVFVDAVEIDPAIAKQRLADGLAWERKISVEAYKSFGVRDPKWDADAIAALEAQARYSSDNVEGLSAGIIKQLEASKRAIGKGCTDPLIRHAFNIILISENMADPQASYMVQAQTAKAIRISRHHDFRKALVEIALAKTANELSPQDRNATTDKDFTDSLENARKLFTLCCADKEIPPDRIVGLGTFLIEVAANGADREQVLAWALDGLTKEQRISAPILALAVSVYTNYAWDARGHGYADTVTAQGWAAMEKRLKIAENCAEQAFLADPYIRATPKGMLSVELGQKKGLKRLDLWFSRGVALNPNDYELYSHYMYYLEPKWHGSDEQMLNFVKVSNAPKNWKAGLPLLLADYHSSMAAYEENQLVYFKRPEVWKDIKDCYEEFLQRYPNAMVERTKYMRFAAYCKQIEVGKEQLRLLAGNVMPSAFRSAKEKQAVLQILMQP